MGIFQEQPQLRLFEWGTVDVAKLRERRDLFRQIMRSPNTLGGYSSDWRVFLRWCNETGRQPLPASSDTLAYTFSPYSTNADSK
jgi:hypothetical protein